MSGKDKRGFSLVEVMVVVSTVSVIMAVTMPAMSTARSRARAIVCRSNLRQLVLANTEYSNDHDGYYVPAADDLWNMIGPQQGGYNRWHGKRTGPDEPFDPMKGPLIKYLADGKIKECPARAEFTKNQPGEINFEQGCGGYGYNMTYIGSKLCRSSMPMKRKYAETALQTEIKKPGATLMFADTAFCQDYNGNQYLIEYSFAEPPYIVINGKIQNEAFASPSIHFRHYNSANVGWADGHVEAKSMAKPVLGDNYTAEMVKMNIGWFEPVDNTPFDLE
jgi:prepilin-type processing-associated H-X9-DG protein/prepilin-type N-terminal cleavage/methylation domain-containing protein